MLRLGKVEEAEEDLAEASHSDEPSDKAKVFNIRGLVKIKKHDWEGAETDFRDAANLVPDLAQGRLENIGVIYLLEEKWTVTYEWAIKISKMSDKTGQWIWMIKGLALEKLGRTQERQAAVREFVEKNRDPKRSLRDLSFYLPDDLAQLAQSWVQQALTKR